MTTLQNSFKRRLIACPISGRSSFAALAADLVSSCCEKVSASRSQTLASAGVRLPKRPGYPLLYHAKFQATSGSRPHRLESGPCHQHVDGWS